VGNKLPVPNVKGFSPRPRRFVDFVLTT
jgi:hypothetical protein